MDELLLKEYQFKLLAYKLEEIPFDLIKDIITNFKANNKSILSLINYLIFSKDLIENKTLQEIAEWVNSLTEKINTVLNDEKTEQDLLLISKYFLYKTLALVKGPAYLLDQIENIINLLALEVEENTDAWYCQEEIRIILIEILNNNLEIFQNNYELITLQLEIAQANVFKKRAYAESHIQ